MINKSRILFDPATRLASHAAHAVLLAWFFLSMFAHAQTFPSGDYPLKGNAFDELVSLAEAGRVDAQVELARRYTVGDGVAADETQALKWARLAASQGSAVAQ